MPTTPPTNLFDGLGDEATFVELWTALIGMHQQVSDAARAAGVSLVKHHQDKLGRQDYCWTGEFRFWVWDRLGCRLYVSNHKGVCFEVPRDASRQDIRAALDAYIQEIGS